MILYLFRVFKEGVVLVKFKNSWNKNQFIK